jgi:hypothetical protein
MKRIIGAAVAGVIAFSGIYALAASLNLTTSNLGASQSVVAACTPDTLQASYTGNTSYSSTLPGYQITAVTIKDTTATPTWTTCNSQSYRVTLSGSGNTSLGEVTGTLSGLANTAGNSFTTGAFGTAVNANLVTGVSVVIGS